VVSVFGRKFEWVFFRVQLYALRVATPGRLISRPGKGHPQSVYRLFKSSMNSCTSTVSSQPIPLARPLSAGDAAPRGEPRQIVLARDVRSSLGFHIVGGEDTDEGGRFRDVAGPVEAPPCPAGGHTPIRPGGWLAVGHPQVVYRH
jgi:hypothetical protein